MTKTTARYQRYVQTLHGHMVPVFDVLEQIRTATG